MELEETTVTTKYQTTIPKRIRKALKVKASEKVVWHLVKGLVFVDTHNKVKKPVELITSKIKLDLDAVRLVEQARGEMA